ncbi:MAG: ATP-binding cassette domain-containing protein [Negativicutes bacterium]|nr:ATP-binding cassette domain-containing protein [Negativicutes bacterium]
MTRKSLIQLKNLVVRYGKTCPSCSDGNRLIKNRCPICGTVWACNHVSFELFQGEILGIVGESGSGKSTLMKSLYFDQPVTSGDCRIGTYKEGEANIFLENNQEQRYIKNHLMGMVYQNPFLGLRMNYSSIGNVAEKLIQANFRNYKEISNISSDLLGKVDILKSRMGESPKNFSGGMQQRVQISKALANNPEILLLDEITTGLDLSVQAKVLDLIKQIRRDFQISMLVVSHDLSVIRMLADRTIVMLDGKIIEQGLTDQILEDPQEAFTQQLVHSLI